MPALTIGMAVYDDFDGLYFTVQALRLYQDLEDVEILIVDNFGCATSSAFVAGTGLGDDVRIVRFTEKTGTAPPKHHVFEEARGDAVLCIDAHVLLAPGVVAKLKAHYAANPDSRDLFQGPLLYDDMKTMSSHFKPGWSSLMYGTWDTDPRVHGDVPFEIPMQGGGLFSCRRDAWLGFNPRFRGFGGEEFYIQEKYRRAGHKAVCLPWLKWMHRFQRPRGVPYPNTVEDRLWNYLVGWRELGLPLDSVYDHFMDKLPASTIATIASEALGVPVKVGIVEVSPEKTPATAGTDDVVDSDAAQ